MSELRVETERKMRPVGHLRNQEHGFISNSRINIELASGCAKFTPSLRSFRFQRRSTHLDNLQSSTVYCPPPQSPLQTFTMSFHRVGLRLAQQMRSPALRSTIQRRFETSSSKLPLPGTKLTGAADNAFNRERAAVKAHAAATSGMRCLRECS
jgi:hypothetical protein